MVLARIGLLTLALLASAAPVLAQTPAACEGLPGSAFGIIALKCADCVFPTKAAAGAESMFTAEPIVVLADRASGFTAGDVIVAVNRQAITTAAGAAAFTYPAAGATTVAVRRGGKSFDVSTMVRENCEPQRTIARAGRLVADVQALTDRIQAVTVRTRSTSAFGFALDCTPSCSRVRAADGTTLFWRFDGDPTVVNLDPSGPAAAAGVRLGDRLVEVEGADVRSDEGSLLLLKSQDRQTLRLTVLRGDQRLTLTLKR